MNLKTRKVRTWDVFLQKICHSNKSMIMFEVCIFNQLYGTGWCLAKKDVL